MIIFDLCCEHEHRFEGWFASAEDFERQQEQQQVQCPNCTSTEIRRIPSASHIGTTSRVTPSPQSAHVPDPVALLQKLGEALIQSSEDVGERFVEEARRIHYDEAPARAIRGQASQEECQELREEGIDVLRLPIKKKPETLN